MGSESGKDPKKDPKAKPEPEEPATETEKKRGTRYAGVTTGRIDGYITAHEAATLKASEIPIMCSVAAKSNTEDEKKASKAATDHTNPNPNTKTTSTSMPASTNEAEKDDTWPTTYHKHPLNQRAPTGANPLASKPAVGYTTASRAFWDPDSLAQELANRAVMENIPFHPGGRPFQPGALHFYPQVPDTTNGPIRHTYTPRHDPIPLATSAAPPGAPGSWVPPEAVLSNPSQQTPPQPIIIGQQPYQYIAQPPFASVPQAYLPNQPMVAAHQGYYMLGPNGTFMIGAGAPGAPFPPPPPPPGSFAISGGLPNSQPLDITGIGKTGHETAWQQARFAHKNKMFAPQDFKPADDDPNRFYYVRELDGNWTQRNRFTIDNMGDCRWYLADEGYFYAVRLAN